MSGSLPSLRLSGSAFPQALLTRVHYQQLHCIAQALMFDL
jgi:hypothetical protein